MLLFSLLVWKPMGHFCSSWKGNKGWRAAASLSCILSIQPGAFTSLHLIRLGDRSFSEVRRALSHLRAQTRQPRAAATLLARCLWVWAVWGEAAHGEAGCLRLCSVSFQVFSCKHMGHSCVNPPASWSLWALSLQHQGWWNPTRWLREKSEV